jgi:hypothetical protein
VRSRINAGSGPRSFFGVHPRPFVANFFKPSLTARTAPADVETTDSLKKDKPTHFMPSRSDISRTAGGTGIVPQRPSPTPSIRVHACSFVALFFFFAVVDRIAVTVGNQVITETELLREIALTAFLNGEKPSFTPENKRKAADQLVEQKLVRKEMDMGHYPEATTDQAKKLLDETAKNLGGEQQLDRQLAADGLTRDDLEKQLLWQSTLLHFIDVRFRPAIQVTAQDVQDYFRKEVLPKDKPGQTTHLADVREQILQKLSAQRADQQLDEWLKHAKATTRIEYKKESFQ